MNVLKISLIVLLAGVLFSSCCRVCRSSKANLPLQGTKWSLVQIENTPIVAENNYYLILNSEGGNYSSRGDCNMMNGSFTTQSKNNELSLQMGATTMAFCPNQAQEDRFFQTLGTVTDYVIEKNTLLLLSHGNVVLIFKAE